MIGRIDRVDGKKVKIKYLTGNYFWPNFFLIFASEAGLQESKEKKICWVDLALKNSKMYRMRLLEC